MRKSIIFLLIGCVSTNLSIAQENPIYNYLSGDTLIIKGYVFPRPSVGKVISWLNMSTMEWELDMNRYALSDRFIDNGCVGRESGVLLSGDIYTTDSQEYAITKCLDGTVQLGWTDFSKKGITKFDYLFSQLEPYFVKTKSFGDNSFAYIYSFTYKDNEYTFSVFRENGYDMVFVKRDSQKSNITTDLKTTH